MKLNKEKSGQVFYLLTLHMNIKSFYSEASFLSIFKHN